MTLSTDSFGDHFEIGVNDVERGRFEIWRPEDIQVSKTYRPLLHFDSVEDAMAFRVAEGSGEFDYDSNQDGWKLFTRDGRYTGSDVPRIVESNAPTRAWDVAGGYIEGFWLGDDVFLRPIGFGKDVQVLAIRAEHMLRKL